MCSLGGLASLETKLARPARSIRQPRSFAIKSKRKHDALHPPERPQSRNAQPNSNHPPLRFRRVLRHPIRHECEERGEDEEEECEIAAHPAPLIACQRGRRERGGEETKPVVFPDFLCALLAFEDEALEGRVYHDGTECELKGDEDESLRVRGFSSSRKKMEEGKEDGQAIRTGRATS